MLKNSNYMKNLKTPSGSINYKNASMYLIAIAMGIIILYYVISTVRNQYNQTAMSEPWLVENTKDASNQLLVPGKKIPRSTDGQYGIEYTYAFWLYIDEWDNNSRFVVENPDGNRVSLSHILHKGDSIANPNQSPGIWLQQVDNDLRLVAKMNTFHKVDGCTGESCYLETCSIGNIPMNKWVHVTLSVINKNVDLYVNGYLKKRCLLNGVPRQNDGPVYINAFGGFKGFLSRVRYFNYSLPVWKIEQIMKQGPSKYQSPDLSSTVPPYLSYGWWEQKYGLPK